VSLQELDPLGIEPARLDDLTAQGLIGITGDRLIVTSRGRPLLDRITSDLIG
jgi:ribosomal protein S19E (S16A)